MQNKMDADVIFDEENNILHRPAIDLPKIKGLGGLYFQKMQEYKNDIALTDGITGEQHKYELVLQKSIRTAITMRNKGITPKDIITICSENHMDNIIPYYAALFIGAISANLDPLLPLANCVHLLKQVRPKLIFVTADAVGLMEKTVIQAELYTEIVVFGGNFEEFLKSSTEEENFKPVEIETLTETANILFTSGSTGMPKAACLSHQGFYESYYVPSLSCNRGDRFLAFSNLYWITLPTSNVVITLCGGNRIVYPRFNVNTAWEVLAKNKVNYVTLNTYQIFGMCANGRPEGIDTSSLRFIIIIGGLLNKEMILRARECFPDCLIKYSYGQTEQHGTSLNFDFKQYSSKPDSVGTPCPGYSYKIVDMETEKALGPNQQGELRIKSKAAFNGYFGIDSSHMWDSDGFLKTGDTAYYDEDFNFYVVGRIKEMLKFQMWHISPVAIENEFLKHPAVEFCVVTSRKHEVDGDHLLGLVILRKAYINKITEGELQNFVNKAVGNQFQVRGGVKFVESFPFTVSDKIDRVKIKQLVDSEIL